MKEQIEKIIEYAKSTEHTQDDENYLSDGEVLDIVIEQLKNLIK
jgi:hypothetical protein|tara:strand:+ start:40 stop:171 length:132 start_codon:yes stop_codon:yes gene_type:complete